MSVLLTKMVNKLEPAVKKKAYSFLEKLLEDPTAPGLHIEPLKQAADSRVRTGRVDQGYRAILFKLTGSKEVVYVFHGIWPHDEANHLAQRACLDVSPINGLLDVIYQEVEEPSDPTGQGTGQGPTESKPPGDVDADRRENEPDTEDLVKRTRILEGHGITLDQLRRRAWHRRRHRAAGHAGPE